MPKATKKSAHDNAPELLEESDAPESQDESASSDLEQEVLFHPSLAHPAHAVPQVIPSMFMPYIEGPKMDWTVNDGLYHQFLKWRLKCENILQCELDAHPEKQQCKKVIVWSRDFGMDQYVSWNFPKDEFRLDTIWDRFEEFCMPQSNEVKTQFDLLTSFRQGNSSVDE